MLPLTKLSMIFKENIQKLGHDLQKFVPQKLFSQTIFSLKV